MTGWADIEQELVRWRDAGREPALWWRDDDVVDATPALDRLLALHEAQRIPLALAVVPARATPALAKNSPAREGGGSLHGPRTGAPLPALRLPP